MTIMHRDLHNSIRMLNDFCADKEHFTIQQLPFLTLKDLVLRVNAEQQTLKMLVSTMPDSQILLLQLIPQERLYQLLAQHIHTIDILLGELDEPIENAILLDTIILLESSQDSSQMRDINAIGSRLRRGLNVAFQGHISILKLRNATEKTQFTKLVTQERVQQLCKKYGIIYCHNTDNSLIYLCQSSLLENCNKTLIVI